MPEGSAPGDQLGLGQLIRLLTHEGLTQVNFGVDGRALPRLAERWTWENDGLSLRLYLREDAVFHDGTALTSSVIADSLKDAINNPSNRAQYPSLSDITAVRPDGELELVIDLSQPSAFLPEELDLPLGIGPQNSVGTGAFRLVTRDDAGVLLERFDQYYLGGANIEQILIRPFDTLRTAWTSLLRGEVDMVTDVPPEAVQFIRNDDIQVVSFARSYQFLVAFNSARPPFTSPGVRRALNAAVDRRALIENVLEGEGEPATGPLWPKHWAYDDTIQPYTFDPPLARSLLDLAGYPADRLRGNAREAPARMRFTTIIPEGFSLLERVGLEVQKQLYDVGVDMQFEVIPFREWDARIRAGQFDAVLVDLISGPTFGRPFIFWRSAKDFKGLNTFGYENPETERLFQILRTSLNEAAVRSATHRLQRALLEDPPALFLAWDTRARAISRRFGVVAESDRDPLFTIWQWAENAERRSASLQ